MDKKRILLISESMGGGLRKHVVQLLSGLNKDKVELFFIHGSHTLDESFMNDYSHLKKNCKMFLVTTSLEKLALKKMYLLINLFRKELKKSKPDIVHCHSSKAGVIGRLAAKRRGVKKIFYTPHAYSFLAPEFSGKKKFLFVQIEKF